MLFVHIHLSPRTHFFRNVLEGFLSCLHSWERVLTRRMWYICLGCVLAVATPLEFNLFQDGVEFVVAIITAAQSPESCCRSWDKEIECFPAFSNRFSLAHQSWQSLINISNIWKVNFTQACHKVRISLELTAAYCFSYFCIILSIIFNSTFICLSIWCSLYLNS